MNVTLRKAILNDAKIIHNMQIKTFMPYLDKYQDFDTNPANEPLEKIEFRLNLQLIDYYLICNDYVAIGAIRIYKREENHYKIGIIFILPEYQGRGIGQNVFRMIEEIYPEVSVWELDTIKQELGLCHLYEKIGYIQTGETKFINDKMTLVFYEKKID